MTEEVKYYLAIDWGRNFCGVAMADSETRLASCFGEFSPEDLLEKLSKLKEEMKVERIVVGVTGSQSGKFSSNSKEIDIFTDDLKKKGFLIEFEEEFFSTQMAQKNLSEFRKKGISKKDNAESARLILEGWLDRNS